jgi:hypothetical protein
MKTPLLVGVALTLLAAVSLSPAMAQGPQLSAGSSWPGVPPRVDPSASTGVAAAPHYELQYGYDKHARWRGHWVLVR